jgi:hypothetical protein
MNQKREPVGEIIAGPSSLWLSPLKNQYFEPSDKILNLISFID